MQDPSLACPRCGTLNADSARFCMGCGSALTGAPPSPPAAPEIERKVITALFCDVVGSTELAERLDPEDVDRLLRTYHAMARRRIEAHGGTLEKFIGDAVLGVFGAPQAHEDDPARAVRAALRIIEDVATSGLDLHVRVGVHTGESVVQVGPRRASEEGIATGDTLNTAARLQNVAPVDGVVVSDATYRRARTEFEWRDLGPVAVKGKAEPIQVWEPREATATGDADQAESTPFLGRDQELSAVVQAFDRAVRSSSVEVVTILADAGMGKSRLVRELARVAADREPGVVWRKGRCLPYGDGISFWALGEIVKSSAGILDTDEQDAIGAKLEAVLREPDPELRSWLRSRLAPLVGLRSASAPPPQQEAFAAWRRFLLSLATDAPAVVVIEDLHWADAALVGFLLDVVGTPADVPLLLVVTARPEVAERHPAWLERARTSTVVQLVSLGDEAIAALVESTLAGAAPELVRTVLDRAAGSPLYAEQLAALVRERGLSATAATLDASAIPPTVQALLAARIDALPRELKPALLDASVIGRVFWSGAVAALEQAPSGSVEPALVDLARRELTRIVEPSAMFGEAEYGFWHALLRDVAYSFLPRAARMTKHRAAAAWITERRGAELGELAEIVADHLRRARELAEATQATEDLAPITADLATALLAAGAHAMRVEPGRAIEQLQEALALLPEDDPRRGDALVQLGRALQAREQLRDAARVYGEAQAWRRERGDAVGAAEIAVVRAYTAERAGDHELRISLLEEARPILRAAPGPGLVSLMTEEALVLDAHRNYPAALARADEAIALARRLGLPEPHRALFARGTALLASGDRSAEQEIRRAIGLALASGQVRDALIGYGRLADSLVDIATPREVVAVYDEALAFARDHGLNDRGIRAQRLDMLELAGRADEILAEVPILRESANAAGDAWAAFMADLMEISVHQMRGKPAPYLDSVSANAEAVGFPASIPFGILATSAFQAGDAKARSYILRAFDETPDDESIFGLVDLVWTTVRIGDLGLARRLLTKGVPVGPTSRGYHSMLAAARVAEAGGDVDGARTWFAQATAFFAAREWAWLHAFGLAGLGRCDIALGDAEGGLAELRQAREIAAGLGAAPLLAEIDEAIGASTPGPS